MTPSSPSYGTFVDAEGKTQAFASGTTIKAIAYKEDGTRSPSVIVNSGQYTTQGVVTTPVISPGGYSGCSNAPIRITMTTTTSGATIRWTADGSTPTPNHGNIYTNYIYTSPTAAGLTIQAMAYKSGMVNSGVDTAFYQLWPAQDCGGQGGHAPDPPPEENGVTPIYDAEGNLTKGFDSSTYTYDAANRLTSATKGGTTVNFYYDGLNRQVARTENGIAIYSVYDGWNVVAEYSPGAPHVPTKAWLYGPGGLVKELTNDYYYYQDGSGSTTQVTDDEGTVIESYQYDLQGTPIILDGAGDPLTESSIGVRHLFNGEQWFSGLKLYDLRNRYYNPDTGRFLQPDPIGFSGDASNMYRYGGNNPVNLTDADGQTAVRSHVGPYFTYQVNPGWGSYVWNGQSAGGPTAQCAAGAQILSGGYVNGVYHDVPRTDTWFQGASLTSATPTGTVVAEGWVDGGYPGYDPVSDAGPPPSDIINHTGILVAYANRNAYILSQAYNTALNVKKYGPNDQWQWNEVNVHDNGDGPYDPGPSGANGKGGGGLFPDGLVLLGHDASGVALFNNGTGWAPIGEASADVRFAQNSGTGNYVADRTTQFAQMAFGPASGEGFHVVPLGKE